MTDITIALITPTMGRLTFKRSFESALPQLGSNDEWFIVGDGPQPQVFDWVKDQKDVRIRYSEVTDSTSSYGNAQRNVAMRRATADYFMFLDDDDVLLPGAFDAVRREGVDHLPLMFKMDYRPRNCILWEHKTIQLNNVGGSMFCLPNLEGRISYWENGPDPTVADHHFIIESLKLWPEESLRWCDDVIIRCDDHGKGLLEKDYPKIHSFANIYDSQIGDDTRVAAFVEIGGATIGSRCKIQAFALICPGVTLENEVFVGPHVCFINDRHPKALGEWELEKTLVKKGASIGANATIMCGVTIGEGAVIGAGMIVLKDVEPGETLIKND